MPKLPPAPSTDPASSDIDVNLDGLELPSPEARKLRAAPGGPASLPAICMFGRYEILGRLAFGGMAEIFLARESSAQAGAARHVVIKRVLPNVAGDEQFVEMFLNEARLAIQLSHPNICHIYEFGDLDGSYFIAMEWIDGVPLGKLIRRARKVGGDGVPTEIAVRIGAQVAEALDNAHRARDALGRPMNIVHRDVTPHNIMVAYDGQVKLLDFGIAKAETQTQKTEAGTVKGKFSYMSPEQCTGRAIDGRSDVFALGICMWETIVGRALYRRETQYETMHAVIHEAPPPLRKYRKGVPESLDAIIQKALAKDPAKRHSSAGVLQGELELWLAENRMVVNSATIARVMDELYEQEIQRGPLVDTNPFGSSFQSLPDKGRPPTPEHSSGSMSAAHPLSHPSITSATPAPLHVPRSRAPKFAILAFLGLLGLGLAMYAMRERDRELEVGATADGESIGESPDAADALREELDERGATGDAGALLPLVATHALIELTYRPAAARVELDGQLISGESPLSIDAISPGSHRIVVTAPDHRPFEEELDFVAGERVEITAHLTPLPRGPAAPPGRISINTRPWSKVYVGPRLLGTTPIADARVTSGAVRLRLVDRDGRTHTKTVRVPAGGSERVFYDLGH